MSRQACPLIDFSRGCAMTIKGLTGLGASLGVVFLLVGCESYTQTSSGSGYLRR